MTARPPSVTQCICSLGCWGASWWLPCSDSDTRSCCKHPRAGFRAAMNVQLLRRMPKTATARTYFIVMFCSREEAASFLNPQTATHVGDENVLSKAILPETVATCFPRRLGRRILGTAFLAWAAANATMVPEGRLLRRPAVCHRVRLGCLHS